MSAIRLSSLLKIPTFSNKDCEKHFLYVRYLYNSITKLEKLL